MINEKDLEKIFDEKPSVRIIEALKALKEFKSTKNCYVQMKTFHGITREDYYGTGPGSECFACLGGASAMVRFGLTLDQMLEIDSIKDLSSLLSSNVNSEYSIYEYVEFYEQSLDSARLGRVQEMLTFMNVERPYDLKKDFEVVPYIYDEEQWEKDMLKIVDYLKSINL